MLSPDLRTSSGNCAGRLKDKVALITGGGSGQGQAVSLLFASAGATVLTCDLNETGLAETVSLGTELGVTIGTTIADVSSEDQMAHWVGRAAEDHGGIDILYNNAGGVHFAPFSEMSLFQWRETMRLELDVVFIPTKAVWPHLIARGGGSIINIASVSGMGACEVVGASAHAAGKGGVIAFTRQTALEGAPHWIRVNSISPGPIITPANEGWLAENKTYREAFNGWPALARSGRPVDVAFAGLFLASDESMFITGVNLPVDGGTSSKFGIIQRTQAASAH